MLYLKLNLIRIFALMSVFKGVCLASCCALAGCGVVDKVRKSAAFELIGLAPDEPCVISNLESRRLTGAYLRRTEPVTAYQTFFVAGKNNREGVLRKIWFDETAIRRFSGDDEGILRGGRGSEATPLAGLSEGNTLPGAYSVSYSAKKIDFSGPLVLGPSPKATEFPSTGQAVFKGPVKMTLTRIDDSGAETVSDVAGRFSAAVGYGSGRTTLVIADMQVTSGPALPFKSLTWSRLGLCGSRVVSSGQGVVTLVNDTGQRVAPFGPPNPESALIKSSFEASHFAATERPAPPAGFGGVFAIQGDTGTLTGVFLSDTQ